jgi:hypothetical protein
MRHSTINASLDNRSPDYRQYVPGFFESTNHLGRTSFRPGPDTHLPGHHPSRGPAYGRSELNPLHAGSHACAHLGGGLGCVRRIDHVVASSCRERLPDWTRTR